MRLRKLAICIGLCMCGWMTATWTNRLFAQDRSLASVAHGASAQERLLMEQIDQLAGAGQINEALASLKRLVDQSQGRLMEVGTVQRAATLSVQLHQPIIAWSEARLDAWSQLYADKLKSAADTQEQFASGSLRSLGQGLQTSVLQDIVKRYTLAPSATEARLILCDLYVDRGWSIAAAQALNGPGTALGSIPLDQPTGQGDPGIPWRSAWTRVQDPAQRDLLLDKTWQSIRAPYHQSADVLRLALIKRLRMVALTDTSAQQLVENTQWSQALARRFPEPQRAEVDTWLTETATWHQQLLAGQRNMVEASHTFGGNYARRGSPVSMDVAKAELASWPTWSKPLERMTGQLDRNPASKPPVGESSNSILPYYPLVHDGKVFVHELTRITAFDAATGKAWPPTEPAMPLYDSGVTAATYFPFGYNLVGAPRGTLTIEDNRLYARVGPPVTGWVGRAPTNEHQSLSSIVALDLARQGSMCPGFPVRLSADEFPHAEFEGSPAVVDRQVMVCVLTRDNVNMQRSIISLDRDTGAVLWRSPVLASGMVSGCEQASLVSHQLLSVAGGRIFVNTNLGAIACLDLEDGKIVWLARYKRATPAADEPYPRPDRFRYRDLTPCMVVGSQIICAPQDCPELFSLDAVTGQLLWSTDGEAVDDSNQLLGASQQNLIVSGDRIYWLDSMTGKVLAAFPSGGVGEVNAALPAPRGYGRGLMVGSRVYWPTQNEIYVFDAQQNGQQSGQSPAIRQRIRLDTRGAEGGNLTQFGNGLIIAGPGRLYAFD